MSKDTFKNSIKNGVAIVDFSAPWCAPCRAQKPIIEKLAARFEGQATVVEVNVDDHSQTARNLRINSVPTLIIFKNGAEIRRFVGLQPEDVLSDALEKILCGDTWGESTK